jgi:hypothetical protein
MSFLRKQESFVLPKVNPINLFSAPLFLVANHARFFKDGAKTDFKTLYLLRPGLQIRDDEDFAAGRIILKLINLCLPVSKKCLVMQI